LNTGPSTLGTEKYTFQKFSFKEHGINDVAWITIYVNGI
jgi:hypothetical protein